MELLKLNTKSRRVGEIQILLNEKLKLTPKLSIDVILGLQHLML